jgi:hypothetical protein
MHDDYNYIPYSNAFGYKFIGCPMRITNAKYSRNALLFNVCFVVDEAADVHCYKPVVKKLAAYLTSLEVGMFRIRNFRFQFTSKIFYVCKEYRECGLS